VYLGVLLGDFDKDGDAVGLDVASSALWRARQPAEEQGPCVGTYVSRDLMFDEELRHGNQMAEQE
jgi:hypothetical protein